MTNAYPRAGKVIQLQKARITNPQLPKYDSWLEQGVCEDYQNGMLTDKIKEKHGVSSTYCYSILRKYDIKLRNLIDPQIQADIIYKYNILKKKSPQLVKEYKMSPYKIYGIIGRYGGYRSTRADKTERNKKIFQLRKSGLKYKEIAKKLNLTIKTVDNVLYEYGMTRNMGSGLPPLEREKKAIRLLRKLGISYRKIIKETGYSCSTISKALADRKDKRKGNFNTC